MTAGISKRTPIVRRATTDDFNHFLEMLIISYTTSDPVAVALGITPREAEEFALITVIFSPFPVYDSPPDSRLSPKILMIEKIARSLSEGFWDFLPMNITRCCHHLYTAVRPGFQGKGGAQMMAKEAIQMAENYGAHVTMMECLTEYVYKVFRPLGFLSMRSIPLASWTNEEGDQLLRIPNLKPSSSSRLVVGFHVPTVTKESFPRSKL